MIRLRSPIDYDTEFHSLLPDHVTNTTTKSSLDGSLAPHINQRSNKCLHRVGRLVKPFKSLTYNLLLPTVFSAGVIMAKDTVAESWF